jgi:hypothetical protein
LRTTISPAIIDRPRHHLTILIVARLPSRLSRYTGANEGRIVGHSHTATVPAAQPNAEVGKITDVERLWFDGSVPMEFFAAVISLRPQETLARPRAQVAAVWPLAIPAAFVHTQFAIGR